MPRTIINWIQSPSMYSRPLIFKEQILNFWKMFNFQRKISTQKINFLFWKMTKKWPVLKNSNIPILTKKIPTFQGKNFQF